MVILGILVSIILLVSIVGRNNWDGKSRFTVISEVLSEKNENSDFKLSILSLEPRQKRAVYIAIPANTLLDVPFGYKKYLASSVYYLGEFDRKYDGGYLISKSIEDTFGIAVDAYIIFPRNSTSIIPSTLDQMKKSKQSYFSLSKLPSFLWNNLKRNYILKTNLSFFDRFFLCWSVFQLRIDQIYFIDQENSQFLKDDVLPDNSVVKNVDRDLFDLVSDNYFEDSQVRTENYSISVINSTGQSKLAYQFSRVLSHIGANVIIKTTSEEKYPGVCKIILTTQEQKSSKIVTRIKNYYGCLIEILPEAGSEQSDIKVILGDKFIK
ncbi:hypothetical protein A2Y99_04975 [Candidatus Gottesmanbacteria bacterium RBG_13_37_7]|uniref:LytR/CpsA/Psr regulator C-terminal domain-containing protein n=1 Tax=Candidatus Gottesmanbacteria bacterium RBG_13_37_7 TaxID=1798369 RepID=A0A1F5YG68_9BACT|nr:MAG: hypothetical protein A2Y99_04975 [Candidatus Gottesmanbacteria bacterium RBG_13_37_7]